MCLEKRCKELFVLALLILSGVLYCRAERLSKATEEALVKYSIRFDSVVNDYYSGGLVGNGLMGACVYKEKGDTLCWELGRTDVCDHRESTDAEDILYTKCRLPIGKLLLPLNGHKSDMVMDLLHAEVRGKAGDMVWRTLVPASRQVLVVEWYGTEDLPDITFCPEESRSPRSVFAPAYSKNMPADYRPNPRPRIYREGEYYICKQPMSAGGEYTTVWTVRKNRKKNRLFLSIAYSRERTDTEKEAFREIRQVMDQGLPEVEKTHRNWWKDFYSRSYVSVGDEKFDAFFWSQLYKMGSATRSDRLPIDLMGPWYHHHTPWPAIWWNLNIQLTYSPMFTVNHTELVKPLCDMLDANVCNLMNNVPEPWRNDAAAIGRASSYDCVRPVGQEHGLLTWTLFYYWKYCIYTGDTVRMKEKFFPLLKLAVNYYRHLLIEGEDGDLHLPVSFSPEYGNAADCNFELSLLRWGCHTLLQTDKRFGLQDPLREEWSRIMQRLTPYPQDEDGFMIGRDVKLTYGHRHYSHLLMLYPLQNFPMDTPENEALARRSILYWLGFPAKGYYTGYTYSGASSMYTLLGDGGNAYRNLKIVLEKFITPNTLYKEAGPVFETPMSALASMTEMLLLSRDSSVTVFPAVPECWKDISFRGFRTEGGFEVDAERKEGKTQRICIKSLKGGTCILKCDLPVEHLKIKGAKYRETPEGYLNLSVPPNGRAEVYVR